MARLVAYIVAMVIATTFLIAVLDEQDCGVPIGSTCATDTECACMHGEE